eukprot:TRINITY_DN8274_c0_g1_i2.p1 TRINITY_DN8274_c0_g1~~TRINITY_DN8274_c0_g1_i2.p1  ORF type:complete len:231 (+),score=25.99 TRINITY_DN8274_c0_g1_i2:107-799(+)
MSTEMLTAALVAVASASQSLIKGKEKTKREPIQLKDEDDYEEDEPIIKKPKKEWIKMLSKEDVDTWRDLGSEMRCDDVGGRKVMLFIKKGQFYCVDALCAHMGHPLMFADIEDGPTIRCSAHRWRFLATGERVDEYNKMVPGGSHSLRPHEVSIINGQLMVCIGNDGVYSSDVYQNGTTFSEPDTPEHSQLTPPSTPGQSRKFLASPGWRARKAMAARLCSFSSTGSQDR